MAEKIIRLSGDPHSRGLQHGLELGPQIRRLLNDQCARINCHFLHPFPEDQIYSYVMDYAAEIERELPSIAEEIQGLSIGAKITYEQAMLLQVRREVLKILHKVENSDCSTFSIPLSNHTLAQTIDLNSSFAEFGRTFHIASSERTPEILMFSFAGLLGYLGMNSNGLAISINMVSSDDWQIGVPPYLLVRHLLELNSVEDCISSLANIKRSSSRSFTICDNRRNVTIEMTTDSFAVLEDSELFHTNHYMSAELAHKDSINFLARNSSLHRLKRLRQLTAALPHAPTVPELFNVFNDHDNHPVGLCSHSDGDPRRTETVATVVMHPSKGTMYVRRGLACGGSGIEMYEFKRREDQHHVASRSETI